jgi:hypothetical protein
VRWIIIDEYATTGASLASGGEHIHDGIEVDIATLNRPIDSIILGSFMPGRPTLTL